jgi:putative SOS response-associated peptidase YedK
MCGRVIQSSGPRRYAIVDGMNVRDSRVNPPRWNAAPSQDLLVIRRNHRTGEVSLDPLRWGLIPYWCNDPAGGRKPINAKCETWHGLQSSRDERDRLGFGRLGNHLKFRQCQLCTVQLVALACGPSQLRY